MTNKNWISKFRANSEISPIPTSPGNSPDSDIGGKTRSNVFRSGILKFGDSCCRLRHRRVVVGIVVDVIDAVDVVYVVDVVFVDVVIVDVVVSIDANSWPWFNS